MIPEIVGEQNFIIIHIHGVQKCIDYFPLIGLVVDAAVFEAADPFDDFFLGEHWLRHLGADQADVQLLFLTFQFIGFGLQFGNELLILQRTEVNAHLHQSSRR